MIQRNTMKTIKGFFQQYGTAEGCAMAVQLAVAEEGVPAVRHEGCAGVCVPENGAWRSWCLMKGGHMHKACSTPKDLIAGGTHLQVA